MAQNTNPNQNDNGNSAVSTTSVKNTMNEKGVEGVNKSNIAQPAMPDGSTFNPVNQQAKQSEMMDGSQSQVDPTGTQATATEAQAPNQTDANTYQATQIGDSTPEGQAAQGTLSEEAKVNAAQQKGVSEEYQAAQDELQQQINDFELDERATVQNQYKQLMDFEAGDTPGWAKGAIKEAEQRLAARGMGSSSMAAGEIAAATMRAALPIAQQDARAFQTMSMEKFNKRAQGTMMKAAHIADLDLTNLNNRQQAAVTNARSFLQMDMSNLNNRQQMAIVNTQSRVQAMLSDQAASNAAKQFNAQSKNDIDMFYSNLSSQVEQFNAAQKTNISRFNSELENQREQFNKKNALLVERSNVEYLRGISTRNTQMQNQANYVNSQNLLDISNTAMANQIQLLRDREAFAFEMTENAQDRALTRWVTAKKLEQSASQFNKQLWAGVGTAVGEFAGGLLGDGIEAGWFS